MSKIFADAAPAYYAKGMPALPLHKRDKRPIPLDWSRYHDRPVEEHQQQHWLKQHPEGNIGLVLGQQSRTVMIDIDTTEQHLIDLILSLLPDSPWVRIGKKGMVLAFRYTGLKTFRIKNLAGETICEHLSDRTQVVMPPSIHPETQRPYTANCEFLSVVDNLPPLDPQIEQILRGALKDAGVVLSQSGQSKLTDFVSRGSRDVSLTEKAGLFAYAVLRGERSVKEAIGMLMSYHAEYVENIAGDPVTVDKHVDNLLRFLRRDVIEKQRILPEGWDEGLTDEEKKNWGIDFEEDQVAWDFDKLRLYLRDNFDKHPEDSPGRIKAVDVVLEKIARTGNLNRLEEERLLQYIIDVGAMGLKVTALRAQLRDLRQGDLIGNDQTEIARSVLDDLEQFYTVRNHMGELWKYTGSHWGPIEDVEVLAKIANEFGHLPAAKRHSDHRGIMSIISNIANSGIKQIDTRGINFANGFLTEDLELVPHSPDYGMTYTLPFRYMPELAGKNHRFSAFLSDCWSKDEDYLDKLLALQEALCVTLFGLGPRFQRAILLKGVAKSGKSQLLNVVQSLVASESVSFVPPHEWSDKFAPFMMRNSVLNIAGELEARKQINGRSFKEVVDGGEMTGSFKNGQLMKFRPYCTQWFASNHSPKTEDTSEGFNRRWLVLEFNHAVPPEDRQIDLGETIIAEEREAIVAWAVLALPRLLAAREFTLPKSHKQLIREMAQENNSVRFFMEESPAVRLTGNTGDRILETKLFKEYWSFCLGPGGARPVTSRGFRAMMRELQSSMHFKMTFEQTELGAQEVYYDGITTAGSRAG